MRLNVKLHLSSRSLTETFPKRLQHQNYVCIPRISWPNAKKNTTERYRLCTFSLLFINNILNSPLAESSEWCNLISLVARMLTCVVMPCSCSLFSVSCEWKISRHNCLRKLFCRQSRQEFLHTPSVKDNLGEVGGIRITLNMNIRNGNNKIQTLKLTLYTSCFRDSIQTNHSHGLR
jgi:hypothetical protein